MTATDDSGLGHGCNGNSQLSLEEQIYINKLNSNQQQIESKPRYVPSIKHDPIKGYGSPNVIKSQEEGQYLLETGVKDGKQIYNVTADKKIVKFQPDNSPNNGYHSYVVYLPKDIPPSVLKQFYKEGKISFSDYTKLRKGKY